MAAMLDTRSMDDDARLLARFATGDQGAARSLTEQFLPRAMRQAWRILGDEAEAEDVAQEAMLKLWRQAPVWREGEARVSTWLYRVTRNLCIDKIRKRRATTDIDDVAEPMDPAPAVLEQLAASEESRALARAIMELPDRQRQADPETDATFARIGQWLEGQALPETVVGAERVGALALIELQRQYTHADQVGAVDPFE